MSNSVFSVSSYIPLISFKSHRFSPWATESFYDLFLAVWDWWWARLLQANDVASETEAEVAGVVTGNLLS